MKVVVAHCRLHPAIPEVLEADGIEADYRDTCADTEAYWRLLCELWVAQETVVLIEQDKIPLPGATRAIYDCPGQWCAYPYLASDGGEIRIPALGFVKFAGELMQRTPLLMIQKVGATEHGAIPPRHYSHLDWAVYSWLSGVCGICWHPAGMVRHEHQEA